MTSPTSNPDAKDCIGTEDCWSPAHLLACPNHRQAQIVEIGGGYVAFKAVDFRAAQHADQVSITTQDGTTVRTEDVLKASAWLNGDRAKPTLYIAGPMTGHADFNYHAFHYAAADLRAAGYTALNPAENPKPNPDPSWQDWMRVALGQLIQADAIALLPGWNYSRGAKVERALAEGLGLEVQHIQDYVGDKNYRLYAPSARTK